MKRRATAPTRPRRPPALALCCALVLAGCSSPRSLPGDDAPTLARLMLPAAPVAASAPAQAAPEAVDEARAIAAYQAFLAQAPGSALAAQVPGALRRLGDLEMDLADRRSAEAATTDNGPDAAAADPDYSPAIARYQALLQAHPADPGNDGVLYQLARAQEQAGQMEAALATLTRLVSQHPRSGSVEEAQFRRGEMLFALTRYAEAEAAYSQVLGLAPATAAASPYTQRALYMQGWSRFKQGDMPGALPPLFAVLDTRLGPQADSTAPLAQLPGLSRADRELVEDSLRVASIALANLEGGASVLAYTAPAEGADPLRQAWRWRVFNALASLYSTQDRPKDAADTLALFAQQQPLHAQAPVLLSRVVQIHEQAGFASLALQAKTEYVERYGVDSAFRRANPAGWEAAQALVQTHLEALARHHHALAQQPRLAAAERTAAQTEALRWYRRWLASFPQHPHTPGLHFLMAEILFDMRQHQAAATAFEAVAYRAPDTPQAAAPAPRAEAGYAALLAHAALVQAAAEPTARAAAQQASADSAGRFAQVFAADTRSAAVLVNRADLLFQLAQPEAAVQAAQTALAQADAGQNLSPAQRRTAHTVLAHSAFDSGRFADAEAAYTAALASGLNMPGGQEAQAALAERRVVSIYRQGEAARTAGELRSAVLHFERAATAAAAGQGVAAELLVTARFDAASSLVQLQDWPAAAAALQAFRQRHPGHALQAQVAPQLAAVHLGRQHWAAAAGEFEHIADNHRDPEVARSARWQVAELQAKALAEGTALPAEARPAASPRPPSRAAGARNPRKLPALPAAVATSAQAWERYLAAHPQPLEPALQARLHLATLLAAHGQAVRATALQQQVLDTERAAGEARTLHSRLLAGQAALALAEPTAVAYRSVALVEPLVRQLKLKKQRLQTALDAYGLAAETGVAEVTTAASFHTATLYQDFGQALLQSQRPKKLSTLEREQYDVMLEEQAFPFEERAIGLHEANTAHSASGLWGPWVQRSLEALAKLKPARYGKTEQWPAADDPRLQADEQRVLTLALKQRAAGQLPEALASLEAATRADTATAAAGTAQNAQHPAPLWTALGLLHREAGHFDQARQAYEQALLASPDDLAAQRNLAVLFDLYLHDPERALPLFQRCQALAAQAAPADLNLYTRWVAELQRRQPAAPAPPAAGQATSTAAASPASEPVRP